MAVFRQLPHNCREVVIFDQYLAFASITALPST